MENPNPYSQNPSLFFDLFKRRHICPTYWSYAKETDGFQTEFMLEENCINGCCSYCYGHDYNEMFAEKPNDEQVYKKIEECRIKCDKSMEEQRKAYNLKKFGEDENDGYLITLSIDKAYLQVPKLAEEIISVIKETQYKDIIDGYAVIEVTGEDMEWNPHIHCVTKKVGKAGALAQVLRRKFINEKYQIYRVHIEPVKYERALTYMEGDKIDDKLAQVEADKKYRNDNKLKRIYNLSP